MADEEWMSLSVYVGDEKVLESKMLFQIDIILSMKEYAGTGTESTVTLADEALRQGIQKHASGLWKRTTQRRSHLENELNIRLSSDILPTCSTAACLRPLLFNGAWAMSAK